MKKIISDKKFMLLSLALFAVIFINTFLCFLVSFYNSNDSRVIYVLIPFIVVLTLLTVFILVILVRNFSSKFNIFVTACINIFIVGVLDTFIFRIISLTDNKNMVQKTGLISVILIFMYFTFIIIVSLLPFAKKKKTESFQEKKI